MTTDSAGGYDGPASVILAGGTVLAAEVNLHQARDGGVAGFVHLGPQLEHLVTDHNTVTLNVGEETGQFTVTGTILLGGQHAGCHVQVAGDGWD